MNGHLSIIAVNGVQILQVSIYKISLFNIKQRYSPNSSYEYLYFTAVYYCTSVCWCSCFIELNPLFTECYFRLSLDSVCVYVYVCVRRSSQVCTVASSPNRWASRVRRSSTS